MVTAKSGEAPRGKPRGAIATPCETGQAASPDGKPPGGSSKKDDKQPGFEKSLERLEAIVREMESGDLSLDKMIKDFEEGMGLVAICAAKLNEVERKIELLVKKDGQTVTEPFDVPEEQQ